MIVETLILLKCEIHESVKSSINAILLNLTVHQAALSNSSVNHLFRTVSGRIDTVGIKEKFYIV
jgi:hypothetical protein